MDIHDTLGEAITMLENSKPRAFGAGTVVDRERLLQLLNHARTVLPEEILAAASIVAQRGSLMASAEEQAEHLRSQALADAEAARASAAGDAEAARAAALADAEAVRAAAQSEAEQLIARGEQERDALIDEHLVQQHARQQAEDLVARAAHQAAAMRTEVDSYVDAKLASMAAVLAKTLDTIEAGRRKVRAQGETQVDQEIVLR